MGQDIHEVENHPDAAAGSLNRCRCEKCGKKFLSIDPVNVCAECLISGRAMPSEVRAVPVGTGIEYANDWPPFPTWTGDAEGENELLPAPRLFPENIRAFERAARPGPMGEGAEASPGLVRLPVRGDYWDIFTATYYQRDRERNLDCLRITTPATTGRGVVLFGKDAEALLAALGILSGN